MGLAGSRWIRTRDAETIVVIADADAASGSGHRHLLAANEATGRRFYVSPSGLGKRYHRVADATSRRLYASCGKCGDIHEFDTPWDRNKWLKGHEPEHLDFVSFYSELAGGV